MQSRLPFDFKDKDIVYVKEVAVADLPVDVQDEADGQDCLYALHDAKGQQLALAANQQLAFALARENNLSPVVLH